MDKNRKREREREGKSGRKRLRKSDRGIKRERGR